MLINVLLVMHIAVLGYWLGAEFVHRLRHGAAGRQLALLDRLIRYMLMSVLVVAGLAAGFGSLPLQGWLAGKLVLFGAVIACGIGIRYYITSAVTVGADDPALTAPLHSEGGKE